MKRLLFPAVLLMLLIITTGCATTPGRIDQNPGDYNGKTVKVKGTVGKIFNIPLTDISVFLLRGEEKGVPVISLSDREENGRVVVSGEVWAFPEDGMNEGSVEAVEAVEDFLVENDIIGRARGREVSAVVLTAVRGLASGLGEIWFILEK